MRGTLPKNDRSNLTLSVNADSIEKMKRLAKSQGVSINTKINDILTKHVYFYRITEQMDSSIIPRNIWQSILELIDEEDFKKILSGEGIASLYSIFVNNNISLTLENLVEHLCEKIGIWCGLYSAFYNILENDSITLLFEHNRGLKWSKILENAFNNIIQIMLHLPTKSEATPNYVRIRVTVSN